MGSFRVESDKSNQADIIKRFNLLKGKNGSNSQGAFVAHMQPGMLPGNTVDVKYNPNATQTT